MLFTKFKSGLIPVSFSSSMLGISKNSNISLYRAGTAANPSFAKCQ